MSGCKGLLLCTICLCFQKNQIILRFKTLQAKLTCLEKAISKKTRAIAAVTDTDSEERLLERMLSYFV